MALALAISCISVAGIGVLADEAPISVTINGEPLAFDVPPVMIQDRVLVPFRAIFEALGATVGWDEETQTASGEKDGIRVELVIDSASAKINGEEVILDVAATKINDRTLVPIRFISESLKAKVDWVDETQTVVITYEVKPVIPDDVKPEYKPYRDSTFNANLIGQHPRLIVGSEISENELQRRADSEVYDKFYKGVLQRGGNLATTGDWIKSTGDLQTYQWRVQDAAMAYLLTGNKTYFERVRANTMAVVAMDNWDEENGGGMSNAFGLSGIACAYDWCYDAFTEEERAAIRDKIELQMTRLKWAWENNTGGQGYWQGDYQNNHHQHRIAGMMFGAIALMGDTDDDTVFELYKFVEQDLNTMVEWLGPDGDSDESPQYLVYGYEQVVKALTAYEGVSQIDLFGKDSIKNMGNFKAYTYVPGFKDLVPWGDYGGGLYYFNNCFFKIASKNRDAQLQQLLLDAYNADPGSFTYPTWCLIFYDDRLEPEPWTKPGYAYFHNIEIANFRSGWTAGDISISLKSGPPGGHKLNEWRNRNSIDGNYVNVAHSKPDANNIFISFAGKRWGEYPLYYHNTPTRLTRYHNTVIIDGKGQNLETTGVWAQPYAGMYDEAFISEFFGSDGYSFTTGNAAKSYKDVKKFDRNVFFIDNRYFVSFDDVENNEAGTMEYLFHNQGDWTGDLKKGYVITQGEDSMELFVTMPVEANAVLSDPLEEEQRSKLGHELAVSNAKASATAQFAAVYFPRLNGEKLTATPVLKTSGDVYELTVKRDGKTDIICVHKTGGAISAADVTANAKTMFYTKEADGVANAVMINGTELAVKNGVTITASAALNVRYERTDAGLKLWAAAPLKGEGGQAQLTVSGLEANATYTQTVGDGASSTVTTDANGLATIPLDLSQPTTITLVK